MTPEEAGREGLRKIDEALSLKPKKDGHVLTAAACRLAVYRDALIEASRSGHPRDRERLSHLNAILSVVVGVHYPLSDPPWEELEKARAWLADLLDGARAST
jgi:type II secretory pathway component PulM